MLCHDLAPMIYGYHTLVQCDVLLVDGRARGRVSMSLKHAKFHWLCSRLRLGPSRFERLVSD